MLHSERARLQYVEAHAKRWKWRSVAFVGVADAYLVRQFLAHFTACSMLVVPIWQDEAGLRPSLLGRQRNQQRNLRIWEKAYARLTVDEGPPVKVAARSGQYDGVVLWDGLPEDDLAEVGAAWVGHVKSGGWLMGLDYRSERCRAVLDMVARDRWEVFREGIWGVRVRRPDTLDGGAPKDPAIAGDEMAPEGPADVAGPSPLAAGESAGLALPVGGGETHADSSAAEPVIAPKRRGRPPGSRNKVAA